MRSEIGCFDGKDVEETMFVRKISKNSFKRDKPRKCIKSSRKNVSEKEYKKESVYEQTKLYDPDFYGICKDYYDLYLEDRVGLTKKQINDLFDYPKETLDYESLINFVKDGEISEDMKKYCKKKKIPPYDEPNIVMKVPIQHLKLK